MLESLIPSRSAEDFASGLVRVTLGGQEYVLEELPMDRMDEWSAKVDGRLAGVLTSLDDGGDVGEVVTSLASHRPLILDALCTYPGVPSSEELRKVATNSEVMRALMGVWSAANPLVATLVEGIVTLMRARATDDGGVSALMSTLRRTSDGQSGESAESSPTESSRPASTPRKIGQERTTRTRSKLRDSDTSSPVTSVPINGGVPRSPVRKAARSGSQVRH